MVQSPIYTSASTIHDGWKILKDYRCKGNDVKKYGKQVLKYFVYSIESCIAYCKNSFFAPGCDAVTLVPKHANCCYCKMKTCHNAHKNNPTKKIFSAYID